MKLKQELAGFYKMTATNADTGETRDVTDWFPNLITDVGLNRIGTQPTIQQCYVGSDQTTPSFTDTALGALVASTDTAFGHIGGTSSVAPHYGWYRRTFRFSMGTAAGNLSEVGVGWYETGQAPCFSRALILDSGGNPTTITILSNEFLDVTYEVRLYAPATDEVGQFTLDGQLYNYTLRAAGVTDSAYWGQFTGIARAVYVDHTGGTLYYSGTLGPVTSFPSGNQQNVAPTTNPYVNGSLNSVGVSTMGLSEGNHLGGIGCMSFRGTMGTFQVEFSPKIPKDVTRTLQLVFGTSWARR